MRPRPQNNINIGNLDNDNKERHIKESWVWEKTPEVDKNYEVAVPIFTKLEGPKVRLTDNANVLDFLELPMSSNISTHIVNETNQCAKNY